MKKKKKNEKKTINSIYIQYIKSERTMSTHNITKTLRNFCFILMKFFCVCFDVVRSPFIRVKCEHHREQGIISYSSLEECEKCI